MKRVVVTGMSGVTALGSHWNEVEAGLRGLQNRVQVMPEWACYQGLTTRLGAPIEDFTVPAHYTRKKLRSMGRVARLAVVASEAALDDAGLLQHPVLTNGRTGVAYGSCTGSTEPFKAFGTMLNEHSTRGVTANSYIQMMSHTAAVNLALFFGATGRVIPTSSACTSGSQGIGYAWEAIRHGYQTVMIAGGAEELCPTEVAVFDTLYATSVRNDQPELTPRPFDQGRDGLVIGEGAGTLILEELEHAQARGATIYAELVGYGTNNDAQHVTQPTAATMQVAMELALESAGLQADVIDYISAHGTATDRGDVAESQATATLFGSQTPISSLKSYLGHTLGACGALESWMGIEMMNRGWFAPTINLQTIDSACGELDYLMGEGRDIDCQYFMNNNFAFGGINTSLIFKRWP
ncbi:beta-ketoacyl-ACP synthase [Aestuariirhabdus haliotis]|uniref:beta-ketoacyl-ACP synthase n=1 Tax=Aestuariirhabdus haliotis TaxID=2918751 RepID=UPI0029E80EE8|nr:beta-ketoacyl-ACP synthase [Aestuariirhabdus haliotis]